MKKLIGNFRQILSFDGLPLKGAISDEQLLIFENAGVLIENDIIIQIDTFEKLKKEKNFDVLEEFSEDLVLLPGMIDCHTHICFAGSRANDFALRIAGKPYLEIAKTGGGIMSSVRSTRNATLEELINQTSQRANQQLKNGITTCEVKSGYGLNDKDELKMLQAIRLAAQKSNCDLIPTCLAAHICPPEFENQAIYLDFILNNLLPTIKNQALSNRVDIFIEDTAFDYGHAKYYLSKAKELGFAITIHADQFHPEGSQLACELGALSADHLEKSTKKEIAMLAQSEVVATVLPGASLGLGMNFAPARQLLDAGCCVAIATDWNPGSAPMGDLLLQASVLAAAEKLTTAETFAGITFRAAKSLQLYDRGVLSVGKKADMIAFTCADYREILYHQGKLKPSYCWKNGNLVF